MGLADKFEFAPDLVPKVKLGLHIIHGIFAFVIFVLEIVLFKKKDAAINGNNGWTFGMCFLTIPAVLYLAMTPRWERTRKAAQPHAMAVVDAIWTILWLSAFATQVTYNKANQCGEGCGVSKGIAALAFFQTVFWFLSSLVSWYTMRYSSNNGFLPGYENLGSSHQNIDPDKAAFSTSMAPHDEEAYAPVNMDDDHHHDDHDDHDGFHSSPYNPDSYGGGAAGSSVSGAGGLFDNDTSYRPQTSTVAGGSPPPQDNPFDNGYRVNNLTPLNDPYAESSYGGSYGGSKVYAPPAADDYDTTGPVQFPSANYDRTLH